MIKSSYHWSSRTKTDDDLGGVCNREDLVRSSRTQKLSYSSAAIAADTNGSHNVGRCARLDK